MPSHIVFHLGFSGWSRNIRDAESEEEAMIADIRATYDWLKDDPIRVFFENGQFDVLYDGPDRMRHNGLQKKGDYWFYGRIHIGQEDDCHHCGGTGISHITREQCRKCGNPEKRGRGTGKIKNFPRYKDKMLEGGEANA